MRISSNKYTYLMAVVLVRFEKICFFLSLRSKSRDAKGDDDLPRWHWVYREFCEGICIEEEWPSSYLSYLEKHRTLLTTIHFQPKGYRTDEQVLSRIESLEFARYAQLWGNIQSTREFEAMLCAISDRLLEKLDYLGDEEEVYVVAGLNCTTIYSVNFNGRPVTVLCLEATGGLPAQIELLLAHEFHHLARQSRIPHSIFSESIEERCVSEGLAMCFSEEVRPGLDIHEYCLVPRKTVDFVLTHCKELELVWQKTKDNVEELMSTLFAQAPKTTLLPEMPPRCGYVYGYLKVKDFLRNSFMTASEAVGIRAAEILRT